MNYRRLGHTLLYTVILECVSWRHMRKCYKHNSSMVCKGVFSSSLLKKYTIFLIIYHMSVSHLVINHTLVWKRLYTFNSLIMSGYLSWQLTEGRNPGKDKVITAFASHCHRLAQLLSTCILFQLGCLYWRKMDCTNCCLLLSPSDLWICSNSRAFSPYMLISRCLDET